MTRMDSVRAASDSAKESVLHAAEVVAPYAETAKDQATYYAHEARVRIAPKVSKATRQARVQARAQYAAHVAPHVPPRVDAAAQRAAVMTRSAARQAADYTVPRVEHAVAATGPVLEEAGSRSTAAWAALRGQVTPKEIQKLMKQHERRVRAGRLAKGLVVLGLVVGGAFVAWKWWDKQANPDWLVEPPAPTEVGEGSTLSSGDGNGGFLDPEVEVKETEAEAQIEADAEAEAEADAEADATERDERR
ncbi:DUF5324 family protein [Streptomyces sp. NPDC056169]|uniref:DUF5324 family protein n=1 Tax=Streptomyces sp. NPDC056169 TaxID=3345734 RepID=UPI0035D9E958